MPPTAPFRQHQNTWIVLTTKNKKRKTYAAMVSAVDEVWGILKLESRNYENTMIFFLSDNGGPEPKNGSNNGPLRREILYLRGWKPRSICHEVDR